MDIVFNDTKTHLVFIPKTSSDQRFLSKTPMLQQIGLYKVAPAVLPIAHNVVERLKRGVPNTKVSNEVLAWLSSPFKLKPLPETFKFFTSPQEFQEISLRFLYTLGSGGLLLDPGMGKSKVVCDYIALMGFEKAIIVCPFALLFVWEDEFKKHRPDVTFHVVTSTDWEKEFVGVKSNQVTIINYTKAAMLKHRIKEVGYQFIHLDEFLIKDHSSQRTQAMTEIGRSIPYRCGGSGTLINNTPLDAFAPLRFLQPSLVGFNFTNFMAKFTVMKESKSLKDARGEPRKVVVGYRGQEEIRSMLESCCIVMTKEHWLRLPEKKFIDINVPMSQEQRDCYYQLSRNYRLEIQGEEIEIDNPLVMMSKLYQISNGFVYINPPEEEEFLLGDLFEGNPLKGVVKKEEKKKERGAAKPRDRKTIFFDQQPKIEALRILLEDKLAGRKFILWFNLEAEFTLIHNLLTEMGVSFLSVRGGEKDIGGKVRTFNNTPETRGLVCQAKAVNYGITVLGKKEEDLEKEGISVPIDINPEVFTEIFYSIGFSSEVYSQQLDRVHRLGQRNVCEYYRLFSTSAVESRIKDAISSKLRLREDMLIDVAKTLLEKDKRDEDGEEEESLSEDSQFDPASLV